MNWQLGDPGEDSSVDLTPLIDVIFLLLVFFILAATFTSPALEVALAKASTASNNRIEDERVNISIDAMGQIYHGTEPVDMAMLETIIRQADEGAVIVFNIDEKAPFDAFLAVLDEAKRQERQKFLINAEINSRND